MKRIVQICILLTVFSSSNLSGQDENNLSSMDKLYGLSLLWKEVSYNFAFFEQIPNLNWDSCYQAYIPKVMESKNDWDYYLELQKFMSLLQDGHTRIFTPVQLRNKYFGTCITQFTTKLIEDKVIITRNIGYLKINNFVESKSVRTNFDSIYKKILRTDGLIIDVRENVGGCTDISQYILRHFTNKPYKTGKWKSPNNIAAHRGWGSDIEWFESEAYEVLPFDNKIIYTRPIVLLADESTFSCAEDFCVDFITLNRGKIVGSKTAGSSGNPLMFKLPGEGVAMICTKQDFSPDGSQYVGFGIIPDIEIIPSIQDMIQNNDPVLEVALKEILNDISQ